MRYGKALLVLVLGLIVLGVAGCGALGAPNFARGIPHTPIPSLPPATMPAPVAQSGPMVVKCRVFPADLIGAWVNAGTPKEDPFTFTDLDGQTCQATFEADVLPIFTKPGVWYEGSPPCVSCHGPDPKTALASMSLATYEGILAGSYRTGDGPGQDILGGGNWEQSKLYERLVVRKDMPLGRPPTAPEKGLEMLAGTPQE